MQYFLDFNTYLLLFFGFLAGFIDSIVGGGGLIQLPAVLIFAPSENISTSFGTNKFAGFLGTLTAAFRYIKGIKLNYYATIPGIITALPASSFGAALVSHINKETLKPAILLLLIFVGIYTFIKKDFGKIQTKVVSNQKAIMFSLISGLLIGFYDGFFGPGTGSFLVFIYIGFFGFDFIQASASAKIINGFTNLSALLFFGYNQHIIYQVAIPLGIANILGSIMGTKMALKRGTEFVRKLFLIVVLGFILKIAYDTLF
jgi:uncharacterized membrane protein YfcA